MCIRDRDISDLRRKWKQKYEIWSDAFERTVKKNIESLEEILKKLKAELKATQVNDRINFLKEQLQKEQTHLSNVLSHS